MELPKVLLLDVDGVIWVKLVPFPGIPDALSRMRRLGIRLVLVSNNSYRSRKEQLAAAVKAGITGFSENDLLPSSYVTALYLSKMGAKKVYLLGYKGCQDEMKKLGIKVITHFDKADAVVLSKSKYFDFQHVSDVMNIVDKYNPIVVGTNPDLIVPGPDNSISPGSGSYIRAVGDAIGKEVVMLGKPSTVTFQTVIDHLGVTPDDIMMVGDNLDTDILFASRHGAQSCLVLTGVSKREDVERLEPQHRPTYIFESLVQLADFFEQQSKR